MFDPMLKRFLWTSSFEIEIEAMLKIGVWGVDSGSGYAYSQGWGYECGLEHGDSRWGTSLTPGYIAEPASALVFN